MKNRIYKPFKYDIYTFIFTYDFDESTNEYKPHITLRRNISTTQAIESFLNITLKKYNESNCRWEAYSKLTGLGLYYFYPSFPGNEYTIHILSAFKAPTEFINIIKGDSNDK